MFSILTHVLAKFFSNLIKRINKYIKTPKTYIPFVHFPIKIERISVV